MGESRGFAIGNEENSALPYRYDEGAQAMNNNIAVRIVCSFLTLLLVTSGALAQSVSIQKIRGEVSVRHGVTEQWLSVAVGDVLRPDDTMKTGPKGSAVVASTNGAGIRRIVLPPDVIVDVADIRDLTPSELMLRLTMEKVRSSKYRSKDDPEVPNAAIVHGSNVTDGEPLAENPQGPALLEWNGVGVLFNNAFYPTCVLKGMELFRLYPETARTFDNRFMVAQALERSSLPSEALNEYASILTIPGLAPEKSGLVKQHIAGLQQSVK